MDSPLTISDRQKPACQTKHRTIVCLIFPRMDQIDFTGPFEVLTRIPDSTMRVIEKTRNPFRDMQGLILTPEVTIAEAPERGCGWQPGQCGRRDCRTRLRIGGGVVVAWGGEATMDFMIHDPTNAKKTLQGRVRCPLA